MYVLPFVLLYISANCITHMSLFGVINKGPGRESYPPDKGGTTSPGQHERRLHVYSFGPRSGQCLRRGEIGSSGAPCRQPSCLGCRCCCYQVACQNEEECNPQGQGQTSKETWPGCSYLLGWRISLNFLFDWLHYLKENVEITS